MFLMEFENLFLNNICPKISLFNKNFPNIVFKVYKTLLFPQDKNKCDHFKVFNRFKVPINVSFSTSQ